MARKVFTKPTANAGGPYTAEANVPVRVTGAASTAVNGVIKLYRWQWGDNTKDYISADPTAGHTYTTPGKYTIKLSVEDSTGLIGRDTAKVTVTAQSVVPNIPPEARLSIGGSLIVGGEVLASTTGTYDPDGPIYSSVIDWGDGNTDEFSGNYSTPVPHTYSAAGVYTVTLTVTDQDSASNSASVEIEISVADNPAPPVAVLAHISGSVEDTTISVSTLGTVGYTLESGFIDWGDGSADDTWIGDPDSMLEHIFSDPGTYTISISVTDTLGRVATADIQVVITAAPETVNIPPVATLEWASGNVQNEVTTVNVFAGDSDGTLASGSINWGDGSSDDTWVGNPASTYTHTYATAGTKTITLTVIDDGGATTSVTTDLVIEAATPPIVNIVPSASLTFVSGQYVGQIVTVSTAGTTDPDGTIASWNMNWGNGTTSGSGSPAASMTRTYAAAGTYSLILTVTDDDGAVATATLAVVIQDQPTVNQAPIASITRIGGLYAGDTFNFAVVASDPDGTLSSGSISWGDNSSPTTWTGSPAASYTHAYATVGSKSVVLSVTDNSGATTTSTITVSVATVPPAGTGSANDYYNTLIQRADLQVAYSLRTANEINTYKFGNYLATVAYDPVVDAAKWTWPEGSTSAENIRVPISLTMPAVGTNKILIICDHLWDETWFTEFKLPNGDGAGGWKWMQVTSATGPGSTRQRIWLEPQMRALGENPFHENPPVLSYFDAREYLGVVAPTTNTAVSACGLNFGECIGPMNCFKAYANTWTRVWIELSMTAGDTFTKINWWMADENQNPVQILTDAKQISYSPHSELWYEYNTSYETIVGGEKHAWGKNIVVLADVADPIPLLIKPVR